MSQPTPSDRTLFLVSGYVLGTLEASESEEFARLVLEDSTILREVDQLQQALEKAYNVIEKAPPPQLRERVLAAASLTASLTIEKPAAPEPAQASTVDSTSLVLPPSVLPLPALPTTEALPGRSRSAVVLSAGRSLWIAAAMAIAAIGFSNYVLWQQLRQKVALIPAPALEQPPLTPLSYTLKSTTAKATAKVTVYPETLTAALDTSGLPQLPPGQVYALWTVLKPQAPFTTDDQSAVLTTTFEVNKQGNVAKAIAVPSAFQQPHTVAALGITVESANAPQSHTGEPILLAKP